ncbi:MAG: NAD-dependent deacylase [Bacteroidales bacterium]|nr:NAD-dependent deacylase [Bacteroidales bacterium]
MNSLTDEIIRASEIIKQSSRTVAFTGAGISAESGIPPFRGENGLWNKYNPVFLDINYFNQYPERSWPLIKEIFYDFFGQAKPNVAHYALAEMEQKGLLHAVITQNIDNLHQIAGNKQVYEFHGNSRNLVCQKCSTYYEAGKTDFSIMPPLCSKCGSVLKPDFVFFGEPIPLAANKYSFREAEDAEVFIIIGTTGEIMPASLIPYEAKKNGNKILEINISPSNYTNSTTDIFLQGKATVIMQQLLSALMT